MSAKMQELPPNFPANPCTVSIPPEYLLTMKTVSTDDEDPSLFEEYVVLSANDDENVFHLVHKITAVSLLRSTKLESILMLRDRCRMHAASSSLYKNYGFLALCHPLLSPRVLDEGSQKLNVLAGLKDPKFAMKIYEKCLMNRTDVENGAGNEQTTESFSKLWGSLTKAAKTVADSDSINLQDRHGNTPLHLAVAKQDVNLVKFLIVLGADPSIVNNEGATALHIAAQMRTLFPLLTPEYNQESSSKEILIYLIYAGAKDCDHGTVGCSRICMSGKKRQMLFPDAPNLTDELQYPAASTDFDYNTHALEYVKDLISQMRHMSKRHNVISALSLDGGGVKGLVLLQILIAIEERLDRKLTDYFDWIVGTSTGSIIAGALGKGKSLREIQRMYFQFKDIVFEEIILRFPVIQSKYNASILENYLKEQLGEETELASIEMFFPTFHVPMDKLVLQRTYRIRGVTNEDEDSPKIKLWRALRRSSAAPTYFDRSEQVYVDGGVASNNPAADLLSDLHRWNVSMPEKCNVIPGCIISVGCGKVQHDDHGDLNLLIRSTTATDGHVVERVKTTCQAQKIPFFRLSPHLSRNVELDTKDNVKLLSCMWDAFLFTKTHRHELDEIADLLKLIGTNEHRRNILTRYCAN